MLLQPLVGSWSKVQCGRRRVHATLVHPRSRNFSFLRSFYHCSSCLVDGCASIFEDYGFRDVCFSLLRKTHARPAHNSLPPEWLHEDKMPQGLSVIRWLREKYFRAIRRIIKFPDYTIFFLLFAHHCDCFFREILNVLDRCRNHALLLLLLLLLLLHFSSWFRAHPLVFSSRLLS